MAKKEKKEDVSGASVADTLKEINRVFGANSVMMLGQSKTMKVDSISSGSFGLDKALGVGGYPRGRLIEISGPESSGKTTLALHAVLEAQKAGGVCAYIDTEHALDPLYAQQIGININELEISQPDNGEQGLGMVESMVKCGKFAVIVVDSVASLVPKSEVEGEIGQANVGKHAKLMSQACRKLVPSISKSKTVVIFINQIRMQINVLPGMNPETTPGGRALKFYSSVRIDIRRIAQIKNGDEVVGGRTRVKVIKNKVAPPFKTAEFDIMYGEGISYEGELLAMGEKVLVIRKEGQTYMFGEEKLGRGYNNARIFLKENPKIADTIKSNIQKAIDIAKPFHPEVVKMESKVEDVQESNTVEE